MPSSSGKKTLESIVEKIEKSSFQPKFMDPITRLAFAVLADGRDPVKAYKAIEKLKNIFVDWNEIRVSRWVEVADYLKPLENADKGAMRMRNMLNRLFDLRGEMAVDFFGEMKINEAKKVMQEIDPEFSRQDIAMIVYQFVEGGTPPLSPEMVDAAKDLGMIAKNGRKEQLVKLIAEQPQEMAAKVVHYLEYHGAASAAKPKTSTRSKKKK